MRSTSRWRASSRKCFQAALAREQGVRLLEPYGEPVPNALGAGIPPVQGNQHGHRHQLPLLLGRLRPVVQRGQDEQHGRAAFARPGAADDHQPAGSQAPVDGVQVLQLPAPEPARRRRRQPRQRRELPRPDRGRHRAGERPGRPPPAHRNRLRLHQPTLQRCPGPLLHYRRRQRVSEFAQWPAQARTARPPELGQVDDQARHRRHDRDDEPTERRQVAAIRRPPEHPHQYASDGNDRGDCSQRPQTAGFPSHSFNCDIRPQHKVGP